VNDLLDLQLCREGVISAMKSEDFEKAAAHVHRFLSIDETTLKLTAGDVAQGTRKNAMSSISAVELNIPFINIRSNCG
jgi:hypothetical protein